LALEMDFWRRSARTSRREKVRNEIIREKWIQKIQVLVTFGQNNYFYGHLQKMDYKRLPKEILNQISTGKGKEEIKNKMDRRHTQNYGRMWSTSWRLGRQTSVEIRCQRDVAIHHRTTACKLEMLTKYLLSWYGCCLYLYLVGWVILFPVLVLRLVDTENVI
jgi:hypothetical protein